MPPSVTFPAVVGIQGGILYIAHPGGEASGPINPDGTARLTSSQGATYDLISSQGTTLTLREANRGCTFLTTMELPKPLPPLFQETAPQTNVSSVLTGVAQVPEAQGAPLDDRAATSEGGGSLLWLWGSLSVLGVGAILGGGILLRGGKTETGEGDAITGILEGFAGMSRDQAAVDRPQQTKEACRVASRILQDDLAALLQTFANTQAQFNQAWAQAMTGLDGYRDNYQVLVCASSEMQQVLTEWAEDRGTLATADRRYAIATLVVGAVRIVLRIGRALIGLSAVKEGERAIAAGTQMLEAGADAYAPGALAAGRMAAQRALAESLAREAGKDLNAVLAESGNELGVAIEKLYWDVFNKRGYHYLRAGQAVPETLKDIMPAAEYAAQTAEMETVLSRLITNARAALGDAARRGAMTAAEGPPTLSPVAAEQWAADVKMLQQWAAADARYFRGNFFQWLEGAVTDVQVAKEFGQDVTATVRVFGPGDMPLLQKILEAGGDLQKLKGLLGPAGVAGLETGAPLSSIGQWSGALGSLEMGLPGLGALLRPQDYGPSGPPVDVLQYSHAFGADPQDFWGEFGHGAWGLFTSPFTYFGERSATWRMMGLTQTLLEQHGQEVLRAQTTLVQAANGLEQAVGAVDHSRLTQDLELNLAHLNADLANFRLAVGSAQCTPDQMALCQRQVAEAADQVQQARDHLRAGVGVLDQGRNICNSLAYRLRQLVRDRSQIVPVLDPEAAQQVEAARILLLALQNTLRQSQLQPQAFQPPVGPGAPVRGGGAAPGGVAPVPSGGVATPTPGGSGAATTPSSGSDTPGEEEKYLERLRRVKEAREAGPPPAEKPEVRPPQYGLVETRSELQGVVLEGRLGGEKE